MSAFASFTGLRRLALAGATALPLAAAPAAAMELSYGSYLPPAHPTNEGGLQVFMDLVTERTDGEVSFTFFPSESAASARTQLTAITDGLLDGGFIVTVYYPTALPVNTILSDMSFWNNSSAVMAAAVTDTVLNDCPSCMEEFEAANVKFLATYATPPYQAMCKPFSGDEFNPQGLRMRVAGEEIGRWVTQIGGVPVNVPNNEAYEAMERGQLDCVIGAVSWLKSLSLAEVAKSVVTLPMGAFQGGSLFNVALDRFEEMDEETQTIMQDSALRALASTIYAYEAEEQEVRDSAAEEGVSFVDASEEIEAARDEFRQSQIEQAAANAEGRGVDNAAEIVEVFRANLEKWEGLIGDQEMTEEEYYELMKREIMGEG